MPEITGIRNLGPLPDVNVVASSTAGISAAADLATTCDTHGVVKMLEL
jgi:hypothetical protein